MKLKRFFCVFVLVLSLSFMLYAGFSSLEVYAPNGYYVHNLDTGLSYVTIQEAIDASETLDGHTILVDAGIYNENIVVNKQISLIGDGSEVTVINAANSSEHAVNVTSSNVEISGFKITGATQWYPSGCGIYLESVSNVSLLNNYITNNTYGIDLRFSNNNTLLNNAVCVNYFGINLEIGNCNNTIIRNNSSLNTAYGIVLWAGSDGNHVVDNIFFGNGHGVTLGYSDFNMVSYNNVSENSIGMEIQQISNSNGIYHNNIVNNFQQVSNIPGTVNVWDDGYPSGGNYWSNYTGSDSNYGIGQNLTGWDGIGDIVHVIDEDNTDRYPLMAPISIFDAGIWNGKPCSVDVVSNSTISNFQLNVTEKMMSFDATGKTGVGFCRVTVPNIIVRSMWSDNYTVLVNKQPVAFREWNGTENTYIHFTYQHSTKEVIIIPEFSPTLILPLLIIFAFTVVVLSRRKQLFRKAT